MVEIASSCIITLLRFEDALHHCILDNDPKHVKAFHLKTKEESWTSIDCQLTSAPSSINETLKNKKTISNITLQHTCWDNDHQVLHKLMETM